MIPRLTRRSFVAAATGAALAPRLVHGAALQQRKRIAFLGTVVRTSTRTRSTF